VGANERRACERCEHQVGYGPGTMGALMSFGGRGVCVHPKILGSTRVNPRQLRVCGAGGGFSAKGYGLASGRRVERAEVVAQIVPFGTK
jgi:hypothetical protein